MGLRVVVVAMGDQQPAAVQQGVDAASAHLHGRHHQTAEAADGTVVVAGHVDDLGAAPGLRMQGGDHLLVRRIPDRAPLRHPPQVDDVADQIQGLATLAADERGDLGGMAVPRAQVQVGQEQGADGRVQCGHVHADISGQNLGAAIGRCAGRLRAPPAGVGSALTQMRPQQAVV